MKANEAPENIYCESDGLGNIVKVHNIKWPDDEAENIKYIRTDAFIDKAVKWLEENASLFVALADEEHPAIGDTKATYGTKSLIYYFKQEFEV